MARLKGVKMPSIENVCVTRAFFLSIMKAPCDWLSPFMIYELLTTNGLEFTGTEEFAELINRMCKEGVIMSNFRQRGDSDVAVYFSLTMAGQLAIDNLRFAEEVKSARTAR